MSPFMVKETVWAYLRVQTLRWGYYPRLPSGFNLIDSKKAEYLSQLNQRDELEEKERLDPLSLALKMG